MRFVFTMDLKTEGSEWKLSAAPTSPICVHIKDDNKLNKAKIYNAKELNLGDKICIENIYGAECNNSDPKEIIDIKIIDGEI